MSDENALIPVEIPVPTTMEGKNGGTLKRGGKNKGAGRPTNEFRASLRQLLDLPKVKAAAKKILTNPDHPQFATLYAKIMNQAHGNPTQPVEHSGNEGGPIEVRVTHKVVDPAAG